MHSSQKVSCPICKKECKAQGLTSHIRLSHPQEDYLKLTRGILLPTPKGQKLVTITSLGYNTERGCDDIHIQWNKHAVNSHWEDVLCALKEMLDKRGYTISKSRSYTTNKFPHPMFVKPTIHSKTEKPSE